MEKKFTKLTYSEVETKKINNFETSFLIQPLERGMANTIGNSIRRVLLSSIDGLASFAVKVAGVDHEFQTIPDVVEDVVQIILNLKKVRFIYNEEIFKDDEIVKVYLKSKKGQILASDFVLPLGVELVNQDDYIATSSKDNALELELFLTSGRGFRTFEENKLIIKNLSSNSKLETKITNGSLIAIDSDFSPIVNVSYESIELNSSSSNVQEKLQINIKTDGSVNASVAISKAANILIQHFEVLANISNISKEDIFIIPQVIEKTSSNDSILISQMDLSVRSYNCLKRAQFDTLEQLSKINKKELEQIKNLGKKSVDEIIEKLESYGIFLEEGE